MNARQVDFLVAEKILGMPCECPHAPAQMCRVHDCALYSQDMQAAHVVVGRMRADGFSFKAWQPAEETADFATASFICAAGPCDRHGTTHHNHHGAYNVEAGTLALAICKAALIAKRIILG